MSYALFDCCRFSSQSRQAIKEDEPTVDETAVTLSWCKLAILMRLPVDRSFIVTFIILSFILF